MSDSDKCYEENKTKRKRIKGSKLVRAVSLDSMVKVSISEGGTFDPNRKRGPHSFEDSKLRYRV